MSLPSIQSMTSSRSSAVEVKACVTEENLGAFLPLGFSAGQSFEDTLIAAPGGCHADGRHGIQGRIAGCGGIRVGQHAAVRRQQGSPGRHPPTLISEPSAGHRSRKTRRCPRMRPRSGSSRILDDRGIRVRRPAPHRGRHTPSGVPLLSFGQIAVIQRTRYSEQSWYFFRLPSQRTAAEGLNREKYTSLRWNSLLKAFTERVGAAKEVERLRMSREDLRYLPHQLVGGPSASWNLPPPSGGQVLQPLAREVEADGVE